MRCLLCLALGLLALEAALALNPDPRSSAEATCPEFSSEETSCDEEQSCVTSQDCRGNAVCCPSACGRSCTTAVYNTQKIPLCPWKHAAVMPELCPKENQCAKDSDCGNKRTCCFDGCSTQCADPEAENIPQ